MKENEKERGFEELLATELRREVERNLVAIAGLEERIMEELSARAPRLFPKIYLDSPKRLAFAAAAAVAIFILGIFLGTWLAGPNIVPGDTVFIVAYPEAKSVAVAGDFNGWTPTLLENRDGLWIIKLNLSPGRYEYAFIIDGKLWVPDPRADEYVKTYFDKYNSVRYVRGEET